MPFVAALATRLYRETAAAARSSSYEPGSVLHKMRGQGPAPPRASAPPREAVPQHTVVEAVPAQPAQLQPFTLVEAKELLQGSTAAHIAGYISLAVSIVTLYSILRLLGDEDSGSQEASACDMLTAQKRYVACVH